MDERSSQSAAKDRPPRMLRLISKSSKRANDLEEDRGADEAHGRANDLEEDRGADEAAS